MLCKFIVRCRTHVIFTVMRATAIFGEQSSDKQMRHMDDLHGLHTFNCYAVQVDPAKVIILEGILVLHIPELREQCSMRIYVDTGICRRLPQERPLRVYTCSRCVVLTATLGATAGTRGGIPSGELTWWQPCRYILPAPVDVLAQ